MVVLERANLGLVVSVVGLRTDCSSLLATFSKSSGECNEAFSRVGEVDLELLVDVVRELLRLLEVEPTLLGGGVVSTAVEYMVSNEISSINVVCSFLSSCSNIWNPWSGEAKAMWAYMARALIRVV